MTEQKKASEQMENRSDKASVSTEFLSEALKQNQDRAAAVRLDAAERTGRLRGALKGPQKGYRV